VGPFVTRDKALISMKKIENNYKFKGIKVLSTSAEVKERESIARERPKEIQQLNSLNGVGIEISNGNGVNRMARIVGGYLKEKGLTVSRLTNDKNFNHSKTRIFYLKGHQEAAYHVSLNLPVPKNVEEIKHFDRPNIKVKVLIGKDLVISKILLEEGKKT
ncbi:MAG: LytR C-terminal domain-containing protein, partial [Thermodesulfobacteriota bacterium]|nr:LytR C-terminal domain-containing protein [Thermodesulfobacteriota bacterium]